MNKYRERFTKKHCVFPVIHVMQPYEAMESIEIAVKCQVDGIFLINHGQVPFTALLELYEKVEKKYPDLWVGFNFLDVDMKGLEYVPINSGFWMDNAGITEQSNTEFYRALHFQEKRKKCAWNGIYFGGVAFKYQAPVCDAGKTAKNAIPFMDIIVTSGDATASAPAPKKIQSMKESIGNHPLAIASGMTPDNIENYINLGVDAFLVATGISESFTKLDFNKLRRFMEVVRRHN